MSQSELKQLMRAEQLFDAGKLDEALDILNDESQYMGFDFEQKSYYQYLKFLILVYQNKHEELIKLGELISEEGHKVNQNLQSFDGLYFIIMGLALAYKFEEASKKIGKAEALLRLNSNTSENALIKREMRISALKGYIYLNLGKIDLAVKCVERTLGFQNEICNTFECVWANLILAQVMLRVESRYIIAIEYTKKAMLLTTEIKFKHYWIAMCQLFFGVIYAKIGEFELSLEYNKKSLAIFKELNNNGYIALMLNNLGATYQDIGNYDLALKYYEESLVVWEQDPIQIEAPISGLIAVALEKGDTERAQKYFKRLENLYNNKKKNSNIEIIYQYIKAMTLKRSSRIRDKAKAEELLKQVIETKSLFFDLIIDAYINLCDLLLSEFRISKNSEALDELNYYIIKLLTIAETSHSYLVFCEVFILQAKLALINFNLKIARRFLTQAQRIAESYGIKRLAMKISYEHDQLIKQLNVWEKLKESEAPLSERWKLAGLNEQIENMVRKRMTEAPKISEEDPVSIFIITEGGTPLFSHSFIDQKSFESYLFSGFLTTIDYFIREMFSEGLDRAIFGEHTLLLKSIPPFYISYIFKGDSYHALQKLNYFTDHIQMEDIWQSLLKSFKINQSIHLKDLPLLNSLITDTFINKSIPSKQG